MSVTALAPDKTEASDPISHLGLAIKGYSIHALIGQGGMGSVFRASRNSDNFEVAIKVMSRPWLESPAVRDRFRQEVEVAAAIDDPRTVSIIESGLEREESVFFYVMEFIDGRPVNSYVKQEKLSTRETVVLYLELCHAVSTAHRLGVLHRDLKPANILVTPAGNVKVLDFGLAKFIDNEEEHGSMTRNIRMGSEGYIAPESGTARADTRLDTYSLGIVLFELLTGGECNRSRHLSDPPMVSLRSILPDASADLEAICTKAVEREPDLRYQEAVALSDDLERYLRGESVSARPLTNWERFKRVARRNPRLSLLITLAALTCILLATGMTVYGVREAEARRQLEDSRKKQLAQLTELFLSCDSANLDEVFRVIQPEIDALRPQLDNLKLSSWPETGRFARIESLRILYDPNPERIARLVAILKRSDDYDEVAFFSRRLKNHSARWQTEFWDELKKDESRPRSLLNKAIAVAAWDPGNQESWKKITSKVASRAYEESVVVEKRKSIIKALQPVASVLRPHFAEMYRQRPERDPVATSLFAGMVDARFKLQLELLLSSDENFRNGIDQLTTRADEAKACLTFFFHPPYRWGDVKEHPIRNRVLAAQIIMKGVQSRAWGHFRTSYKARSGLIKNLATLSVPVSLVVERAMINSHNDQESIGQLAGVLRCLAHYPTKDISADNKRKIRNRMGELLERSDGALGNQEAEFEAACNQLFSAWNQGVAIE